MATREQLIAALRKADQNGDTKAAARFATMLKQGGQDQTNTPQGDNTPQGRDFGGLYSAVHNFEDTATFGLGDHLAAAASAGLNNLFGGDQSYEGNLAQIRADAAASANGNPTAAITGDVAGIFGGGGVIGEAARAAKALPVAGKLAEGADALLSAKAGQPIANVARASAAGALGGGIDSAAHGGNEDQNLVSAGAGAVLGPVAGKVAGSVVKALTPAAQKAMSLLADKIGETPATLQSAYTNFANATGRVPTMAELMGMKSRGELASVAADNPTIGVALNDASTAASQGRTQSLSSLIDQTGGPTQDISSLIKARDSRMTAAMDPIRDKTVNLDESHMDLLSDPRMRDATAGDPKLRADLARQIQNIEDTGHGQMSVEKIDAMRQALQSHAKSAFPGNSYVGRQFSGLANELADTTLNDVPEYRKALTQYGSDQDYIDSFQHGMAGNSIGEASDPQLIRALGTAEGQAGHASGVMSRLANKAGNTEAGAESTALDLTQPGTIRAVTEAVGPQKAARLAQAGAYERRAQQSLDAMTPSNISPQQNGLNTASIAHGVGAAAGHSPTGVAYHIARIFGGKLKMSPQVQQKIAQYMTDPTMTQQGINLLRKAGANNDDIRRFQSAIAGATGAEAGNELSSGSQ